jgi:hypothetical protein
VRFKRDEKFHYEVTPQKLAAARRKVQRDRDSVALFPDLARYESAEQCAAEKVERCKSWQQRMRDLTARKWREVRSAYRRLNPITADGLKRYWELGHIPGTPYYLASLVDRCLKGHSCWHDLVELKRLQLIRDGKMKAPWKKN